MKNKYLRGALGVLTVAMLGVGVVSATGVANGLSEEEKVAAQERQAAMRDAIETDNYAEWEALMIERIAEMEDSINEETFDELVERYENQEQFQAAVDELKESREWTFEEMEELKEEYEIGDGHTKMKNRYSNEDS